MLHWHEVLVLIFINVCVSGGSLLYLRKESFSQSSVSWGVKVDICHVIEGLE